MTPQVVLTDEELEKRGPLTVGQRVKIIGYFNAKDGTVVEVKPDGIRVRVDGHSQILVFTNRSLWKAT